MYMVAEGRMSTDRYEAKWLCSGEILSTKSSKIDADPVNIEIFLGRQFGE